MILAQLANGFIDLLMKYLNFAQTQGEGDFSLMHINPLYYQLSLLTGGTDSTVDFIKHVDGDTVFMYFAGIIVLAIVLVASTDTLKISEVFRAISLPKVLIFAAAIFSFVTFYKSLMVLIANAFHDSVSTLMLDCRGAYINPISICIISAAIATLQLRNTRRQILFLVISVFLVPGLFSYLSPTPLYVVSILVPIVFGITGLALYKTLSIYTTYIIMSAEYLVAKFFYLYYSTDIGLLNGTTIQDKIGQFFSCMRLDLILIFIILLVLFGYKTISAEEFNKKLLVKDLIFLGVFAAAIVFSFVCRKNYSVSSLKVQAAAEQAAAADKEPEVQKQLVDVSISSAESSDHLVSSSGNEYDVVNTTDGALDTCWQDGLEGDGIGSRLTYHFANEMSISEVSVANGNQKDPDHYISNSKISQAIIHFMFEDIDLKSESLAFEDSMEPAFTTLELSGPIRCDAVIIEIVEVYPGTQYQDTCISEVQFKALQ